MPGTRRRARPALPCQRLDGGNSPSYAKPRFGLAGPTRPGKRRRQRMIHGNPRPQTFTSGAKISVPFFSGGGTSASQCSQASRSTARSFLQPGQGFARRPFLHAEEGQQPGNAQQENEQHPANDRAGGEVVSA